VTGADERARPSVQKIGYVVPFSDDVLLHNGAITEDEARSMGWTPPPPTPRLRRLRRALSAWWWEHRPHVHLGPCEEQP
jgi:hypothetical protein